MKNIVTIRASSLGLLLDCPASWEAKYIKKMHLPASGKARLGTAVHASTAAFDQAALDGSSISIDDAAAAAVDAIWHPDVEVDWDDDNPATAEKIAISLTEKYCKTIAPEQQYLAVEVPAGDLQITDLGIALTGTIDRVRQTPDGPGICDIKTGKTAVAADGHVKTSSHVYQIGVYEILAEHALGSAITGAAQIVGMTTAITPASQRIGTGDIVGARSVLIGDSESPGILAYASRIIQSGAFHPNPSSMICSKKYCANFASCKVHK